MIPIDRKIHKKCAIFYCKKNLLVAENSILIFAYYYLPACNKMDITPKKMAQIVTLRQHSNMTIRKTGKKLNVSKSNVGRIF